MQNLKREKDRLSVENDSLREVNKILNRKMTEIAEEIKTNGTRIDENRKEIERIDKILKIKMKKNKQSIGFYLRFRFITSQCTA